jgi:hypothetical protein
MIVTFPVAVHSVYATAEIAARRLLREELIEVLAGHGAGTALAA